MQLSRELLALMAGAGSIAAEKQDSSAATWAPLLRKEDGLIDFSRSAIETVNRWRGFQPWPGAYTKFRGKNLAVVAAKSSAVVAPIGEIRLQGERTFVGCGANTSLELLEIQLEGKKRMSTRDFLHGYHLTSGERLG